MDNYLLIVRSITQAQHAAKLLERAGIGSRIYRAPSELTDRGCSYAVRIRANSYLSALQVLRQAAIRPLKIVRIDNGVYREEPL
jgi:hypothetical protein